MLISCNFVFFIMCVDINLIVFYVICVFYYLFIFFNFLFFVFIFFFFSSRRRHTRSLRDWSSDVCSSDLSETPPSATCQQMTAQQQHARQGIDDNQAGCAVVHVVVAVSKAFLVLGLCCV